MRRAVNSHRVSEAVGLTLSRGQVNWIGSNTAEERIKVLLCPCQEYQDDEPFDAIASLGVLEHFARPEMDRAERIGAYSNFFEFCSNSLVDGGKLALQTIVWMNIKPEQEASFMPEHIFPETTPPHLAELVEAAEPWFHTMQMHNRPLDYAKTLRAWIAGMRANRAKLKTQFGAEVLMRYLRGYTLVVMGFEHNVLGLTRRSFLKRSSEDLLSSRSRLMRREAETTT